MADAKTPMQKQREHRRAPGWREVKVWLTPEGQQRIARLIEPGESLSTLIDRALVALEALHSGKTIRARTSEVTSEQPEDLQALIAREVSRYFTSDHFRGDVFIPLLKQALTSFLPSDLTRYLTSEAITVPALPVHSSTDSNDQKTAVLPRLRAMQVKGFSFQKIADELNAEGVPTLSHKGTWKKGTIYNLLKE